MNNQINAETITRLYAKYNLDLPLNAVENEIIAAMFSMGMNPWETMHDIWTYSPFTNNIINNINNTINTKILLQGVI